MSATPATILPATRPLILWVIVIFTLLLIPLKITSYGYAPGGDARRHVGRAFSDKPFRDIVVMRPEYQVDQSFGWESLLRLVRQSTGWNTDTLMAFAIITTMLCLFIAPMPWLRWPEAWLAALLAFTVATPDVMGRFSEARPLMFTEAILVALLFGWSKPSKTTGTKLFLTVLGFAASVFFHGAWYLWVLLLAAFFMAGEWRAGLWLTLCWVAGVALGAAATGHPAEFLHGTLFMAQRVLQEKVPQWMLVGEFNPSGGELPTLILLALVYLWRRQMGGQLNLMRSPVFWVMALAWVGGFQADRWWADWGIPAVLVWLAMQFEEILPAIAKEFSWQRILLGALLALPLYLHLTNDLDRRYSHTLDYPVLDEFDPALKGWMPESGGIFYNDRMDFFYNTFYQNPRAPWHYMLGFEPALMPDEDLHVFRNIQRHPGNFQYYEPWIAKMKPADRLVIYSGYQPPLPQLEWYNPVSDIWLGRLPKTDK